jgi:hypothetical protein
LIELLKTWTFSHVLPYPQRGFPPFLVLLWMVLFFVILGNSEKKKIHLTGRRKRRLLL